MSIISLKHVVILRAVCSAALIVAPLYSAAQGAGAPTQQDSGQTSVALLSAGDDVPLVIRFAGSLGSGGQASTQAAVRVTFSLFKDQDGGIALWSEEHVVSPNTSGRFVVYLGAATERGLPQAIFSSGDARWLEVAPEGGAATPRIPVLSVPYALKSADSDTLGGNPPSAFVQYSQIPTLVSSIASAVRQMAIGPRYAAGEMADPLPPVAGPIRFPIPSQPVGFRSRQFFFAGLTLSPPGPASSKSATGVSSSSLDLVASAFDSATATAQNEDFRWQADPVGSDSANPSGQLSLLFGSANAPPHATGLAINPDGSIVFGPTQVVPLTAIQAALVDAGLALSGAGSGAGSSVSPVVDTGAYSWQQTTPGGTGLQVGENIVKLTPCPKGVDGTDAWHFLYVSGTGTPEAVLMTGGTCKPGAPSGTVEFMASNPHPSGYKIGSATDGVQEALNDAITPKTNGQGSRSVLITPGEHLFHARLSIRASSVQVKVSGAIITCAMTDTCIFLGDPSNANTFQSITLDGLRVRPGIPNGTWSAVEDNAEGSEISNMGTAANPTAPNSFGHLAQIDNDQAAHIDNLTTSLAPWARCDTSFCSSAIYGPGPTGTNAGVIWVSNSNLSLQCGANGVDNFDGNTLHISDSIVEGYAQFGVRSYSVFSNVPSVLLTNVYEEVGNCTNPLGTGIAGLIVLGGYADTTGGAGPIGALPQFASSGPTQYNYYIIVHSSTLGDSPEFLAGTAATNGVGYIKVLWNQIGRQGTITYDVLRTVGGEVAPYGTGHFSIATGLTTSSCVNQVCSFLDNAALAPSPYIVPSEPLYSPTLRNWPGSVILTQIGDIANNGGLVPTRYYAQTILNGGFVSSAGAAQPSVFAQECDPSTNWSPIWMQCVGGNAVSNDNPPVVGTLFQLSTYGGAPGGLKGRINFEVPPNSSLAGTHVITLSDSNPTKTLAWPLNRPPWDATDTYIGYDQAANRNSSQTQLSFGSPVAISNYIANAGDDVSWLERLTATLKAFHVPVSAPSYQTVSNCASPVGTCGSAAAGATTIAPGTKSITVSSTAVTAVSEINIEENRSYGAALGVVCDSKFGRQYWIAAQIPGVSFTIESNRRPTAPACLTYTITN